MRKKKLENLSKRGNTYYIDYYDKTGQRVRITTETDVEDLAKEFRDEYFKNLKSQQSNINAGSFMSNNSFSNLNNFNNLNNTQQNYTFDDIALKFLEEKTRTCRPKTLTLYKFLLKNLTMFFTNILLKDINKILIKSYENHRLIFIKQALVSKELSLLKSILSLAIEYEMLNRNPFDSYNFKKVLKGYEPKERWLTPEEARRLIENSNELLAMLLVFLFNSGLRISEALHILYTDISRDEKTGKIYLVIRKEISKNKKDGFVPLTKQALEQINKMKIKFPHSLFIFVDPKGNPYKTTPKKALETAKRKAGFTKEDNNDIGGFHITRHSAGSWWLQDTNLNGDKTQPLRIEIVSQLLRHQDISTTQKHYAKLNPSDVLLSLDFE